MSYPKKSKDGLVARWEDGSEPEMLLSPSPFGQINGREDFRGFTWCGELLDGSSTDEFLPEGTTLENLDLSFANIHPLNIENMTMRNVYAEHATFVSVMGKHATVDNCEFDRCDFPRYVKFPFRHAQMTNCTFRKCKFPDVLCWADSYDNCRIEDMRLDGPKGGVGYDNPLITNTTITGKWKEVELHQTVEGNQLSGCDLTGVTFGAAVFSYIDITQINVPDDIKRFTVVNWSEVLPTITQALEQLLATTNTDSKANLYARITLSGFRRDLHGYREEAPDRPRGARYCRELRYAEEKGFPELLELYKDAGAQFMLDPTTTG